MHERADANILELVRLALLASVLLLSPLHASAFDYDESVDGDILSNTEDNPTLIGVLDPGLNVISGGVFWTAPAVFDGDKLSVTVPPGAQIEAITLEVSNYLGNIPASTKVFETPDYQALESRILSADGIYPFAAPPFPLPPGDYGFTATFVGGEQELPGSYDWEWTIQVPEPGPGAGSLAAAGILLALARVRPRSATRASCDPKPAALAGFPTLAPGRRRGV